MSEVKNEKEKSAGKALQEKLFTQKKNGLLKISDQEKEAVDSFCEGYKSFLDSSKTEREATDTAIKLAVANGFKEYDPKKAYSAGEKVYWNNHGKSIVLCVFGTEPLENGVKIAAAHIDSPRLDLKQHPVYESNELCLFKTHYYGGIRKYQWPTIPLALHGVICKANGEKVTVTVGEDETDPIFIITDLLPHLAQEQSKRTLGDGIRGEELNVLIGSRPFNDDEVSKKVKLNVLSILFEKYGIVEDDFISAELEIVPTFKARDVGFDRGLIAAYGQDDRSCAYTALEAILDCENPTTTCVTVLTDKEEIGSMGNTGLQSHYLEDFIFHIAKNAGTDAPTVLSHSSCLSADVSAAFDPTFPEVNEPRNASYCNYGVAMCKFTGSRGKSGCNDAHAEFVSHVRNIFDSNDVIWQTCELGRVDLGGGGTVAAYVANLGIDVVDVGVPVLSMHSPYEVTAKLDVYTAYKGFSVFFKN
ncbi:MAG: aminopeptidase [Oscillospiraceae bacterium]|nr:aminopeptidase [Oscillospiraceae bacterium]